MTGDDPTVLLELPDDVRHELKEPLGPVTTDAAEVLDAAGDPLVAVGDVVTYHLLAAGRQPDVALVDERTERSAVDDEVAAAIPAADVVVANPAATLTGELLAELSDALEADEPTVVRVEGEEDLAALPAVLAMPDGATVVYGQPGEGMVHARVTPALRSRVRNLFDLLAGDHQAALDALGVA